MACADFDEENMTCEWFEMAKYFGNTRCDYHENKHKIESLCTDNARLKRIEAAAREVDFRADNFGHEPLSHINISLSALRAELEKGSGDG